MQLNVKHAAYHALMRLPTKSYSTQSSTQAAASNRSLNVDMRSNVVDPLAELSLLFTNLNNSVFKQRCMFSRQVRSNKQMWQGSAKTKSKVSFMKCMNGPLEDNLLYDYFG
jgi:hypothetical protein